MKIVHARANKLISGDFFFIFKFDKDLELCNRKWNVDINVFIFSIIL
jgi:hypothetical protein